MRNQIIEAVILVVVTAFATKQYVLWQLRKKLNGHLRKDKYGNT